MNDHDERAGGYSQEVQTQQPVLRAVAMGIHVLADLHRGDILLYEPVTNEHVRIVAQAQPHSVPPVYTRSLVGQEQPLRELPVVTNVLRGSAFAQGPRHMTAHRSHIVQRAYPVMDGDGTRIGVLSLEKSLVEHERHLTRRAAFRRALHDLRDMVLRGRSAGLGNLSPFRETDGIMVVNEQHLITYVSGLASYHYRRLGYSEELIGKPVAELDTADKVLVERAFAEKYPFEDERQEEERLWIRKVIPVEGPSHRLPDRLAFLFPYGFGAEEWHTVLITIHDATAARRKEQEQIVRQAMVQEIHHRVKNNLQTVASLLRLQSRRAEHEETRQALTEAMNRILSIAVVHEFLSQHEKTINMRDVAGRIARQVRESVLDPAQRIRLEVEGDSIFLHAHRTTMIALVINELILNALEHGFGGLDCGEILISFVDEGDRVRLVVRDTGAGLPDDFSLEQANSLGLRIVQTIVGEDLRGTFDLKSIDSATEAVIVFPKDVPETFE
ncbi:MAG: sensor histidine kinase [Chloroflexota bacterium]|nr:sensor histidine kinase [Chloroflexota bacterium]